MSLENVIKEINSVAESKSSQIIQQGQQEAKNTINKTNEKIQKSREKTIKKTSEIVASIERTEMASLKLLLKKQKLNAKKEIIDTLFSEAKKALVNLEDSEKEKILRKLLQKGKKEVHAEYFYSNS
ncbi:MAG: V-type ATP synthase subunit E family protein, partial [Candidatus Micrarchaeota archaeon]